MKLMLSGSADCQVLNSRAVTKRFKGLLKKGLLEKARRLTKTWNFSYPLINPVCVLSEPYWDKRGRLPNYQFSLRLETASFVEVVCFGSLRN